MTDSRRQGIENKEIWLCRDLFQYGTHIYLKKLKMNIQMNIFFYITHIFKRIPILNIQIYRIYIQKNLENHEFMGPWQFWVLDVYQTLLLFLY